MATIQIDGDTLYDVLSKQSVCVGSVSGNADGAQDIHHFFVRRIGVLSVLQRESGERQRGAHHHNHGNGKDEGVTGAVFIDSHDYVGYAVAPWAASARFSRLPTLASMT